MDHLQGKLGLVALPYVRSIPDERTTIFSIVSASLTLKQGSKSAIPRAIVLNIFPAFRLTWSSRLKQKDPPSRPVVESREAIVFAMVDLPVPDMPYRRKILFNGPLLSEDDSEAIHRSISSIIAV